MAELKIDITKAVEEIIEKLTAEGYTDVKHGKWEQGKCTNCKKSLEDLFSGDFYWDDDDLHFCPNCGARMDLDSVTHDRCSNYMDCDGNCFIDDTPCDCNGNIEKCKGR